MNGHEGRWEEYGVMGLSLVMMDDLEELNVARQVSSAVEGYQWR